MRPRCTTLDQAALPGRHAGRVAASGRTDRGRLRGRPQGGPPATGSRPPDASLAAEGGDAVVGQLGSFTWGDGGSDSPWLPGAPIAVGAGEPLSVTLADDTPVGAWTAVRAPAGSSTGAGAAEAGEGSGLIGFAIGQPGRWTVAVTIGFLAGGSATWYWQLEVT